MATVVIYTTAFCSYCVRAKALLSRKGVAFQEIDVSRNREKRRWLADVTGQETVPQIFINGVSVGGCDDIHDLDRQGKLDPMLQAPAQV